jgi:hypothetical protein
MKVRNAKGLVDVAHPIALCFWAVMDTKPPQQSFQLVAFSHIHECASVIRDITGERKEHPWKRIVMIDDEIPWRNLICQDQFFHFRQTN